MNSNTAIPEIKGPVNSGQQRSWKEFMMRCLELQGRMLKVKLTYDIAICFDPWKIFFIYRRCNRIYKALQQQLAQEHKNGYWI